MCLPPLFFLSKEKTRKRPSRRVAIEHQLIPYYRNTTLVGAFSHPDTYLSVFEEVSKYNVQLNVVERLWAVSFPSNQQIPQARSRN